MNYCGGEIPILIGVAEISQNRKGWLCDVWGVLHDGLKAFPSAIEACSNFIRRGGEVVLISNSPRPSAAVLGHLSSVGVPRSCFSALVTSGDVTRNLVEAYSGKSLFHLGPERDKCLFDGLNAEFSPPDRAAAMVCTGFFEEDNEVPEDYDGMLAGFACRGVPMICANPDLVVEQGSKLLPCAGLLAQRYSALGQTVIQAGKPYSPIYEAAMRKFPRPLPPSALLAIGDGMDTDIKGACAQGIDSIYIASRVNMGEAAEGGTLAPDMLDRLFAGRPFRPYAAMPRLRW